MLLIKNGHVKTMVGDDIENGSVLIDDEGKIAAVGKDIEATEGAEVIDAGGRLVTPGLVEAHCHIGIGEPLIGWAGSDINEGTDPITPHMRAIDGINPYSANFHDAIRGGVTAACVTPGSANIIGGTATAIKSYGKRVDGSRSDEMRVRRKPEECLRSAVKKSAQDAYGDRRPLQRNSL